MAWIFVHKPHLSGTVVGQKLGHTPPAENTLCKISSLMLSHLATRWLMQPNIDHSHWRPPTIPIVALTIDCYENLETRIWTQLYLQCFKGNTKASEQ